jgi:hypothetical protein
MPRVDFSALPDDARTWVFAADRPVTGGAADLLLAEVDRFLDAWAAHGQPLTCARDWREDHFLAIAVDQRDAHASGCSIDGLFRVLTVLQPRLGATLLGGGRVLYRDANGMVRSVTRDDFSARAGRGEVTGTTPVFDATVSTAGAWRERFETTVQESWHLSLL